jgi:hypothetical protein
VSSSTCSASGSPAQSAKCVRWPKICKLAHAFLWEYGHKRLKLAQHLGQPCNVLATPIPVSTDTYCGTTRGIVSGRGWEDIAPGRYRSDTCSKRTAPADGQPTGGAIGCTGPEPEIHRADPESVPTSRLL